MHFFPRVWKSWRPLSTAAAMLLVLKHEQRSVKLCILCWCRYSPSPPCRCTFEYRFQPAHYALCCASGCVCLSVHDTGHRVSTMERDEFHMNGSLPLTASVSPFCICPCIHSVISCPILCFPLYLVCPVWHSFIYGLKCVVFNFLLTLDLSPFHNLILFSLLRIYTFPPLTLWLFPIVLFTFSQVLFLFIYVALTFSNFFLEHLFWMSILFHIYCLLSFCLIRWIVLLLFIFLLLIWAWVVRAAAGAESPAWASFSPATSSRTQEDVRAFAG